MIWVRIVDLDAVLRKAYDLGYRYDKKYGNCAQGVTAAIQEVLDMRNNDIFKAACGLAGGLGLSCNSACGALSGGTLMISSIFGREQEELEAVDTTQKSFILAKNLHDRFVDEYGSGICKDVQKKIFDRIIDFWDPKDVEEISKNNYYAKKCHDVVGKAASWAVEIILDEQDRK